MANRPLPHHSGDHLEWQHPIDKLLTRLSGAVKSGSGWKACCPAHEDRNPSLSIWEAEDGSAALKCHAGCERDAVLAALGLTWRDLKPPGDNFGPAAVATKPHNPGPKPGVLSPSPRNVDQKTNPGRSFSSADEAAKAYRFGEPTRSWPYHDADGKEVARVLRWDRPDGKVIRPIYRDGAEWRMGSLPTPRPLYRLPEVIPAQRVFVCEGEKATDALRSVGLVATTSPHGAESADKADWSFLAGKEVVILPDNDSPGWKYAERVRDMVSKLDPIPAVKLLILDGLPDKGDAFDWIEQRDAAEPKELQSTINTLADTAPLFRTEDSSAGNRPLEVWKPFPVDVFPPIVRDFILEAAKSIDVDPSYVALPLLAMFSALVGNTHRIRLKPGWTEPSCLWTVIVGRSGDRKSAPLEVAMKPIRDAQRLQMKSNEEAWKRFEAELATYERDMANFKKGKSDEPPMKPDEPKPIRFVVDDVTVEGMAPLLMANFRGLLLAKDELSGWFGSFDRYSSGKGGDAAKWIELFGGRSITIDRKGSRKPIFIPRALVSVTGSIQRDILRKALSPEHLANGLAARLLFADPPSRRWKWTDAGINPSSEHAIARIVNRLLTLEPQVDEQGDPEPSLVDLTPEAKSLWIEFYNAHCAEHDRMSDDLSAAWSKLLGYAARLALVIHFIRWATDDPTLMRPDNAAPWWRPSVDMDSMQAAIRLSEWFGNEARRIYATLQESPQERIDRELLEWLRQRGEPVSPRDVTRGPRAFRDKPLLAEEALQRLHQCGAVSKEFVKTDPHFGGRSTIRFRLRDSGNGDETRNSTPNEGVPSPRVPPDDFNSDISEDASAEVY